MMDFKVLEPRPNSTTKLNPEGFYWSSRVEATFLLGLNRQWGRSFGLLQVMWGEGENEACRQRPSTLVLAVLRLPLTSRSVSQLPPKIRPFTLNFRYWCVPVSRVRLSPQIYAI